MFLCRGSLIGECRAYSWSLRLSPVAICTEARYCDFLLLLPPWHYYIVMFLNWNIKYIVFFSLLFTLKKKTCFALPTYVCCVDGVLLFYYSVKLHMHQNELNSCPKCFKNRVYNFGCHPNFFLDYLLLLMILGSKACREGFWHVARIVLRRSAHF